MISLEINFEEVRKKNYEEVAELTIRLMDEVEKFEGSTKAELVLIMAEKLEEAGYPIFEIKEAILERLGVRVSRQYVSSVLPDRFKKAVNIAKGKKGAAAKNAQMNTGGSGSTTLLEPIQQEQDNGNNNNHREPLPDIQPEIASSEEDTILDPKPLLSIEYVESLENQIKALKGEVQYADMKQTLKIVKLDKYNLNRLFNASVASKKEVVITVDIRTQNIVSVYSDTEWNKIQKATGKKKDIGVRL